MYPEHLAARRWELSPRAPGLAREGNTDSLVGRFRGAAIVLTLLCMAYLSMGVENYCYLIPTIDTRYAPRCSELKFRLIKVGITKNEVLRRIGEPLGVGRDDGFPASAIRGDEVWCYTGDGAHPWADFAWLGRWLVFRDGRVVEKRYWTFYD